MLLTLLQKGRCILFILSFGYSVQYVYATQITNLVTPVPYYTNHEKELLEVEKKLAKHKKVSLIGISGIGKTQLARKYADLHREKYSIIWFFDGNIDLNSQFVELARKINQDRVKVSEGMYEAKDSVIEYLKAQSDFLIVVDNLKINSNAKSNLFLDWENNGHIIFCSQDANLLPNIINISYLTIESSQKLIKEIVPDMDDNFVIRLAKELRGYPITTAKSAIFLDSNNYITFEEYEKYLQLVGDDMESYVAIMSNQLKQSTINLLTELVFLNNQSISKSLIQRIAPPETFLEDLIALNRYQVISTKTQHNNFPIFEMHDKLREALILHIGEKKLKEILDSFVDKVNKIIPRGKNTKQELVLSDETLISNLEEVLIQCKKYDINEVKVLELKKNLMSFYLGMGVTRCQDFKEWFLDRKHKFLSSDDKIKSVSAEFLILIGIYDYYIGADYVSAMSYLHEAEKIILSLEGYDDLKYMVYLQLAQAHVHNAEMEETLGYIKKAQSIDIQSLNIDLEATLLHYIEAKYYLSRGEYKDALVAIDSFVDIIKNHPIDYYFSPVYIMKATILSYLEEYNTAYDLVKPIYDKEIHEISKGNAGGIRLRVIIELARAEFGKGQKEDALRHARQAIDIYRQDKSRKNFDLTSTADTELADAFLIYADTLSGIGKKKEAIHHYAVAEAIYYNKYGEKISNLDEISLLYYKAIKAAIDVQDYYSKQKFTKRLISNFGTNHKLSKMIIEADRE